MTGSALPAGRHKLADQIVDEIRKLIDDGTFARGARLPAEAALAARFGAGRSSVREAVRVLAHIGELQVRRGDGTFVSAAAPVEPFERRLARARLDELYEAREIIEVQSAALAAERRTKRDVDVMRRELRRRRTAQECADARAFLLSDFAFHTAVVKATKNAALTELYASFVSVLVCNFDGTLQPADLAAETDRYHEQLCDAIEERDIARAVRLSRKHLSTSQARLRR